MTECVCFVCYIGIWIFGNSYQQYHKTASIYNSYKNMCFSWYYSLY